MSPTQPKGESFETSRNFRSGLPPSSFLSQNNDGETRRAGFRLAFRLRKPCSRAQPHQGSTACRGNKTRLYRNVGNRHNKKRSAGQQSSLAAVHDKKRRTVPEASSVAAPVDSGTDPPPAGRFRPSCRTPTAQVQSERPLQLLPLLWTARRRLVEAMP